VRLSRTRIVLVTMITLVIIGGVQAMLWRFMAHQVEKGFLAWVQQRRAQGWIVSHATPSWGGWPFAVKLSVRALSLEGGALTVPGGVAVDFEQLTFSTALPWVDTLQIDFHGTHRARIAGQQWRVTAERMAMHLPLATDVLPREARLTALGLRVGTADGEVTVARLAVGLAASSTATEAEAAMQLAVDAEGVVLAPGMASASDARFGRDIAALSLDLALTGPIPPAGLPSSRAEAWRDSGGTLELRSFALRWGPVAASAAATLALDEDLQPMGAGTLRVAGASEALGALAEAGLIGRRAANTARSMLPLLARQAGAGGAPDVELPLTIEARTLAVARIPVLRVQPLDWAALPAILSSD